VAIYHFLCSRHSAGIRGLQSDPPPAASKIHRRQNRIGSIPTSGTISIQSNQRAFVCHGSPVRSSFAAEMRHLMHGAWKRNQKPDMSRWHNSSGLHLL
jgi:hypothetical protein